MENIDTIKRLTSRIRIAVILIAFFGCFNHAAFAIEWPQEVTAKEGKIIVYQPQPEKLDGNLIVGRSAMSIEPKNKNDPIFGVFWFTARINTERDDDIAIISEFNVTKVKWPESKDAQEQRFTAVIENAIPQAGFTISKARLSASLATAEQEIKSLRNINNEPPTIKFINQKAVLLIFDGKPHYTDLGTSHYQQAVNTPFLVIKNKITQKVYLSDTQHWLESDTNMTNWQYVSQVPQSLIDALPKSEDNKPISLKSAENPGNLPQITVATSPTELIVTDGNPVWVSLPNGELLYVKNTETPWLRDLSTGQMYILLSGRWYRAKKINDTWTFVPPDEMPNSFLDIPPESDIGGVRTSLAGTPEAEEALLDAQIPQTAVIDRKKATLTVTYDGEPTFKDIPSTNVAYAENTATQVLLIHNKYYAVDNGVWFVSNSPTGPWQVADNIPEDEIAQIPPSTPVYNTTYVHVYHSTPSVVYVGYTPGYLWSFPYYGVPIYGTGWYYPPYPGLIYYPRPPTWGMHVGYNPWTGWHYGVTWGVGFVGAGIIWGGHHHHHGHHGGWYHGHRGNIDIDNLNVNVGDINIGNNISAGNRRKIENRIAQRNGSGTKITKDNIYNRINTRDRLKNNSNARQKIQQAKSSPNRKNNIYADRQGKVVRRTDKGWQQRTNKGWQNDKTLKTRESNIIKNSNRSITSPNKPKLQNRIGNNDSRNQRLNRTHQARQSGMMRERARTRTGGGNRRSFRR